MTSEVKVVEVVSEKLLVSEPVLVGVEVELSVPIALSVEVVQTDVVEDTNDSPKLDVVKVLVIVFIAAVVTREVVESLDVCIDTVELLVGSVVAGYEDSEELDVEAGPDEMELVSGDEFEFE